MTSRHSYIWLAIVPVLLFSAWLGARSLNADALWFDEYYSLFESGGAHYGPLSPLELAARVASYSVWPPAYNYILAGWSALVGWSPVAGRILSWLFGLLSICVVYRLARQLAPGRWQVALAAAVLVGSSAFYIHYFHELRGYTLHILLGCGASSTYWSALYGKNSKAIQAGFVATLILLLYSHPVGLLWYAVLMGYHLVMMRHAARWKSILLLFLIAGISFIPWSIIMVMRVKREIDAPRGLEPLLILGSAGRAYTNQLFVLALPLCLLTLRRIRQRSIQFYWWWLVGIVLLALAVDRLVPFLFHIRLIMAALPALLLLVAAGLGELRRRPLQWVYGGSLALWLFMGVSLSADPEFMSALPGAPPVASNPGFETAVEFIQTHAVPEDAVLFRLAESHNELWLNATLQHYFHGSPLHFSLLSLVGEQDEVAFAEQLSSFTNDADYLWFAEAPGYAPDSNSQALQVLLDSEFVRCQTVYNIPDMRLELYARNNRGNCPERAVAIFE